MSFLHLLDRYLGKNIDSSKNELASIARQNGLLLFLHIPGNICSMDDAGCRLNIYTNTDKIITRISIG